MKSTTAAGKKVDDIGIWNGIPGSADSVFAEKVDATTVISMGSGEGATAEVDEGWPGPGTAYKEGGKTDVN